MSVIKQGQKIARPTLIMYALTSDVNRFGVIVGKAVGGATDRNRVKRRLRHAAYALMDNAQPMDVVIRALPPARSGNVSADLGTAWAQAEKKVAS